MSRHAIVHVGPDRALFGGFPRELARATGWPLVDAERCPPLEGCELAYLLAWDREGAPPCPAFVPFEAVRLCQDKRAQAEAFTRAGVSVPETRLVPDEAELRGLAARETGRRWALKWPVGCGGVGHRVLDAETRVTRLWTAPFLVQELIELDEPTVYRTYCAGGEPFGWVVRRYPPGRERSIWVALAAGAECFLDGEAPPEAAREAEKALRAVGVWGSFGCVDLLRARDGRWLVLEVNTDGLTSYVARRFGVPELEGEIEARLVEALRRRAERGARAEAA